MCPYDDVDEFQNKWVQVIYGFSEMYVRSYAESHAGS